MNQENEKTLAKEILSQYEEHGESKLEKLKKLDRKAKLPSTIFAYTFGIIGALVLGIGMCLAMNVIGNSIALGVVIGCIGIGMIAANYPIYNKLQNIAKKKYGNSVLKLADEILNK